MSQAPPLAIGRYKVVSELGRGMMGVVYKAEDPLLGRTVALKVVRLAFPVTDDQRHDFERRFVSEARIVARLGHPNIVVVYDVGHDDGQDAPFMALEYLLGRTLAQRLSEGPPPHWQESLRIVLRLAEALHYAHRQGVVHRDVKPANVMLLESGEPKLMDFGLARLHTGFELTSAGQFMGTPLYMSPEQAKGQPVDGRSDLFSLGAVLYTLLTGQRAFEAESIPRILNRVTYDEPPAPSRLVRSLPSALDYVLARAMAKPPEARYPDGRSLAEDLDDILGGRPARHRADWQPPPSGEQTLDARRAAPTSAARQGPEGSGSAARAVLLGRDETSAAAPASPRSSRTPLALLVLSMLAFGAALYSSAFWRERLALTLGVLPERPGAPGSPSFDGQPSQEPRTPATPVNAVSPLTNETPSAEPSPAASTAATGATESAPDLQGSTPAVEPPVDRLPPAPSPSAVPSLTAPAGVPSPERSKLPSAPPSAEPTPTPTRATPQAPATPRADPSPRPTPKPSGTATTKSTTRSTTKPRPKPAASAKLMIALSHDLKSGRLQVDVDGEPVYDLTLKARQKRYLLIFARREGQLERTLPVQPGERRITIQVSSGKRREVKEVSERFKAGETRRFELVVESSDGGFRFDWR